MNHRWSRGGGGGGEYHDKNRGGGGGSGKKNRDRKNDYRNSDGGPGPSRQYKNFDRHSRGDHYGSLNKYPGSDRARYDENPRYSDNRRSGSNDNQNDW